MRSDAKAIDPPWVYAMSVELCAAAARNNAAWCDAMARAHNATGGAASAFDAAAWINWQPAPRFYPNLVTLGGPDDSDAQLRAIRRLMAAPPAPGWAVKDSFAALDLAPLGFHPLFEARWIHRPARALRSNHTSCGAHRVTSEDALTAWERAWRGGTPEPGERLFPPALLAAPEHAIIAVARDGAIVAGCVASRSEGVLGISNLFVPIGDDGATRASCLAGAMDFAPGLPLVGYESGDDLARMKARGFAEIGKLRIWQAGN